MNSELDKVLEVYKENKARIRSYINSCGTNEDECLFGELCFCIMTPQSRAKNCREAVEKLKKDKKLFTANMEELRGYLKGVRFPEVKAQRIIEAREKLPELKKMLSSDPENLRNWLKEEVNGLGLKESAHFMRNIGFRGLAIIDVHIMNFMKKVGKYGNETKSLTNKKYTELERNFLELSRELKIPPEELDIAIWMYQSGERDFYG